MKRKKPTRTARNVPKVRIVCPANRSFQLRYHCPETKLEIRISTGCRDEEVAQEMKRELEAKLLLGIPAKSETQSAFGPEMDFSTFREHYRKLHLDGLRDGSAVDAESRLDLAEQILHPKTLGEFATPFALQKLQAELLSGSRSRRKKPRSPHTVRGYMNSVLAALNWAYTQQWLTEAPRVHKLKVSKLKAMKGRPITAEEFETLLQTVPKVVGELAAASWIFVMRGLWESALRLEEIMHVSWDAPRTIRPVWREGKLPVLEIPATMQKNDTEESIPLLPGFNGLLQSVPLDQRTGWIFNPSQPELKGGGRRITSRPQAEWVGKVISRIGKASGIVVEQEDERTGRPKKFVTAHDLRRSCGERLREAGVPPLVICRVMRHSSWDTTRRHYAPGDIQSDAEVLHRIFQGE